MASDAQRRARERAAEYLSSSSLYSSAGSRSTFDPRHGLGNPYGVDDSIGEGIQSFFGADSGNDATKAFVKDFYGNALLAGAKTKIDENYAKTMSPLALDFQDQSMGIASKYNINEIKATGDQSYRLQGQQFASEEKRIGLTGDENRKQLRAETDEFARKASIARSNIKETGKTFYG